MNDAIRVENLSKTYPLYAHKADRFKEALHPFGKKYHRDFYALKDVSFRVPRGEAMGIIGKNGSGKSTLLKILSGVLAPSSGIYRVNGRLASLLELGTGFNAELSGIENIYFNASLLGLSKKETDAKLDDILAFADIGDFIRQPVRTYSHGMYMRLAFAVIAHVDADILVIDEALAVGDAFFVQKCMRFLRKFKETGTLLFVSHDMAAVRALCPRAVWLESGKIRAQGAAKEIGEAYFETVYEERQGAHVVTSDPKKPSFGKGGAGITEVRLLGQNGEPLARAAGGETVILGIDVKINQLMFKPIIGFFVKDRLGQSLFGENTHQRTEQDPVEARAGQIIRVTFKFNLPLLAAGDYSVCVAVAEGTLDEHVQHHWIHDALVFKVQAQGPRYGCLVKIPMEISVSAEEAVHDQS